MLRITHFGESILEQKGAIVSRFDGGLRTLAQSMIETMYESEGIGLAAQQIDQAIMLCVVDINLEGLESELNYELDGKRPPLDLIMPMTLVNPHIAEYSEETDTVEEGCLSFPGIRGDVTRPSAITVHYQDVDGHPHVLNCDGLFARCIQHEVDHLNGVLFTERMTATSRSEVRKDVRRLKTQTLQNTRDAAI